MYVFAGGLRLLAFLFSDLSFSVHSGWLAAILSGSISRDELLGKRKLAERGNNFEVSESESSACIQTLCT